MIFVKFTIDNGGVEYLDYAWFKDYGLAHYENGESITDKDIIREVYAEGRRDEEFEENFNEETNVYTDYDDDTIAVHKVKEMTQKELDVLVKMGVLYK
jgi:protein-disulfide isomerase-like protein with CxxC motif